MRDFVEKYELDSWALKLFIVFNLLFPAYYSPYTDVYMSAYYPGFSWAYFFLCIYMALLLIRSRGSVKKWSIAGFLFAAGLLLYNLLSLYFNYIYLHWYWEQVNNTVAFLFIGILMWVRPTFDTTGSSKETAYSRSLEDRCQDAHPEQPLVSSSKAHRAGSFFIRSHDNIRFLIHCIVLSNVGNLVYAFFGYCRLLIVNNQFIFYNYQENAAKNRYYWIYSHKCEYALMLTAFLALFLACRKKFRNTLTWLASIAVLAACLFLSHSWTGFAAFAVVIVGYIAGRINGKHFKWRRWYWALIAAFIAAAGVFAYKVFSERDLSTLALRIPIWKESIATILKYPQGWGLRFGESLMKISTGHMVNNAHNVFLNQILRFSIPVGICFILIFAGIVLYMVVKRKGFMTAFTWLALLLVLNVDYSVMSINLAMVFLAVYLVSGYREDVQISQK